MSTTIKFTNLYDQPVTEQQIIGIDFYQKKYFIDNALKKTEEYEQGKLSTIRYYLDENENMNILLNQYLNQNILFYKNISTYSNYKEISVDKYFLNTLVNHTILVEDVNGNFIYDKTVEVSSGKILIYEKYFLYPNGDVKYTFEYFDDGSVRNIFFYDDSLDDQSEEMPYLSGGFEEFDWTGLDYYKNGEPKLPSDAIQLPTQYKRNYEENVGVSKYEPITNKLYEDYFVENRSVGIKNVVDNFISSLNAISKDDTSAYIKIKTLVETSAKSLWDTSVSYVQQKTSDNKPLCPDDRPLYWARIKMQVALKKHPYFLGQFTGSEINSGSNLEKVLQIFEEKSRNYTGIDFSKAPTGAKKILITGFDPFQLNDNINQSNPSGCVALNLFNTITDNKLGYIQSMLVPVRYKDFDGSSNSTSGQGEGIIEKYIKPWIDKVDMIITISQALPDQYHIDVFATATRGGFEDNMNYTRIKNSKSVSDISPETIATTLPENFAISPSQAIFYGKYFENENEYFNYAGDLDNSPHNAMKSNFPSSKIYYGPGGNYLSNEIFYRVAKIRSEMKPTLETGHFHVAQLQNYTENFDIGKTNQLIDIVKISINNGIK